MNDVQTAQNSNGKWAVGGLLPRANWSGANLLNQSMYKADMKKVNLMGADMSSAKWNEETKWPAGIGKIK